MTYLAMDIGASSGKLVKARLEDGRIVTQVVHRFENTQRIISGHLCWDIEMLYREMVAGLRKAGGADYITIDTWAVDYVLLDAEDRLLTPAVAYRDGRTDQVACPVSREELYRRTGIQHQKFNTVYQLLAQKAGQHQTVVRLKGGDPFVFGRGGEECLYLKEQGVPFEVVPGITSAVAGLAAAGIPITHRGIARGFRVYTAHDLADGFGGLDFAQLARTDDTLVLLMGLSRLYVGVHYPSDVLAGAIIGTLCGLGGLWLVDRWEKRHKQL